MTFPIATVGLAQVASTVSSVITQSFSESSLLFAWGAVLLFVGRRLGRLADAVPQDVTPVTPVLSRLTAPAARVEVTV
jgi:hypothetical protein